MPDVAMSKWDVMDVCMRIGAAASPAVLMAHCTDLHIALRNVNRKSVFLEDACSCVLRRLSKLHMHVGDEEEEDDEEGSDSGDGDNSTGMAKLQANGCEFVRPLIDELVDENQIETDEIRKQRGVLLAFILELLSLCEGDNSELLDMAMACGVDSHVLLAVPRCREVYSVATAVLIPECDEDEDDEMEALEDSMHEDPIDDEQLEAEDRSWILHRVAAPFGLSKWTKFVVGTDDSSAFPIWSTPGLHRLLVHHLLTAASFPMLSPSSVLFLGTPIVNEALSADKSELNRRDWIGPTIQLLTNAMVSFNDPQARTNAFHVLRMFLGVLKRADRFHILERMVLQCPYGNVQAVFVDILRADCVDDWNNTSTSSPQSRTCQQLCLSF
ncbi:TPA: hypothetical protein N0F65_009405 [Lagenidium giganteum]|uniref:Uncharacterized protein n=1 Tax=Lagenidium giganteum TaxID=4803 RepID=A0AAV2ZAR2_9STRA|nr:TPA: hypothetical protein N0F65_009405 [Lagenidium giganteum]